MLSLHGEEDHGRKTSQNLARDANHLGPVHESQIHFPFNFPRINE